MNHLRKIIRHSRLKSRLSSLPYTTGPQLPTELLLQILLSVEAISDLAALCCASRTFKAIAEPRLYHTLEIESRARTRSGKVNPATLNLLYQSLRHSSVAKFVINLRIWLQSGDSDTCADHHLNFEVCECDTAERRFWKTVRSLNNLQSLHIHCTSCVGRPDQGMSQYRHGYSIPPTPGALRDFMFFCKCTNLGGKKAATLLSEPWLSTVESLGLQWEYKRPGGDSIGKAELEKTLKTTNILSNLTTLIHDGSGISDIILCNRSIRRLGSYKPQLLQTHTMHRRLCQTPAVLTHLFLPYIRQWILGAMAHNPSPYLNLIALGILELIQDQQGIPYIEDMPFISDLKHLESIVVRKARFDGEYPAEPDPGPAFPVLVGEQYPTIRQILLIDWPLSAAQDAVEWERETGGNVWISRVISNVLYVDIITGKLGF